MSKKRQGRARKTPTVVAPAQASAAGKPTARADAGPVEPKPERKRPNPLIARSRFY